MRYTTPAIALHWLMAIGIGFNLIEGLQFDRWGAQQAPHLRQLIDLHKSIGLSVVVLIVARIIWRAGHRPPPPLAGWQRWELRLSTGAHHLLYLLMVIVPVSGWLHDSAWSAAASHPLMWFHLVSVPRWPGLLAMPASQREAWHHVLGMVHSLSAKLLLAVLTLHVLGALKHQWLDRQPVLQRMGLDLWKAQAHRDRR